MIGGFLLPKINNSSIGIYFIELIVKLLTIINSIAIITTSQRTTQTMQRSLFNSEIIRFGYLQMRLVSQSYQVSN